MKEYVKNGVVDRIDFCRDIALRNLSTEEMWVVAANPQIQKSYSRLEYDNKIPIKYWNDDYLNSLCNECLDDTIFNPDYLSYLDDVASYVASKKRVEKQSIPSKINEFLGRIVYSISDFLMG